MLNEVQLSLFVDRHSKASGLRLSTTEKRSGNCAPIWRIDVVPLWNHNGFVHLEPPMPTTLTLKNIPDEVYERLKDSAESHRRSLNSEAIVCLETVLLPGRIAPAERLARARALRNALPKVKFRARDVDAMKREGRQ
ncbi:MAG: Arc family DNA-binding protein [Steroidobacteraceae bacterium]|jgi:plasmid stability protein